MSLLKRRPEITLLAPPAIVAGRSFGVRARLDCPEPLPVDGVSIELLGTGVWMTSSQYGRHRNTMPFARWVARPVRERRELSAGEHEYPVTFALPPDVPGSFVGRHLSIEWTVRVRVDIPWWPDARAAFDLWVVASPHVDPPPPRVLASSTDGPRGRKPYAEVSLGSSALDPGGQLQGRVALSNTAHNDYRALRFTLVAVQSVPGLLSPFTSHEARARWVVPLSAPAEDEPIAFSLRLPADLVPAFETQALSLKWFLEVKVEITWATNLELWIPVVVRPGSVLEQAPTAAPLAVGSDRLALVWAEAARRSGYELRAGELVREQPQGRRSLRREHQGRKGLRLRAEATFRDLDLGLRAERGRLRCRDPEQARVLGEHTDALADACPVQEADDERIVCVLDDSGTRVESVAGLAERFEALWQAMWLARDELPPPGDMAEAVPWFRAAAQRLGGELDVASMDVWGVRNEIPYSLQTQWDDDGTLARTMLEVRPSLPIDARWHQRWTGEGNPAPMPEGLAVLVEGSQGLHIDAAAIRVFLPPGRERLDPHVDRLEGMLEVARRLSGQGPGYR
ncbi:MAG: hypothetical protein H6712_01915 [Myxococcales bacterium]|nr:hypothetical protein [Myxococcales bacterium]